MNENRFKCYEFIKKSIELLLLVTFKYFIMNLKIFLENKQIYLLKSDFVDFWID